MLRCLSSGHIVWQVSESEMGSFSPAVLSTFTSWSQQTVFAKEAGGLILGFIDSETNGLLAEFVTEPGRGDRRTRTSFYRSSRHQFETEKWHRNTNGRGTLLGLWHTHPEACPTPSSVDLIDFHNVIMNGSFSGRGLVYLIVGTQKTGCWYAKKNSGLLFLGYF